MSMPTVCTKHTKRCYYVPSFTQYRFGLDQVQSRGEDCLCMPYICTTKRPGIYTMLTFFTICILIFSDLHAFCLRYIMFALVISQRQERRLFKDEITKCSSKKSPFLSLTYNIPLFLHLFVNCTFSIFIFNTHIICIWYAVLSVYVIYSCHVGLTCFDILPFFR